MARHNLWVSHANPNTLTSLFFIAFLVFSDLQFLFSSIAEKLRKRAADEKDKQASSKEVRLLRKLLRTDDPKEREALFEDAFTPKEALLVSLRNGPIVCESVVCDLQCVAVLKHG